MYNKSYEVLSFDHFHQIVRLADYYCALPVLSASLYAVLWNSPGFTSDIPSFPGQILGLSKKLRHPVLFRESLVHMVSKFLNNEADFKDDRELEAVVIKSYCGVMEQVLRANLEPTKMSMGNSFLAAWLGDIASQQDLESLGGLMGTASYYRAILNASDDVGLSLEGADFLERLLKSNLVLDKGSIVVGKAGIGFLCAKVRDKDLPWDSAEIDW